jgi:cytoskeletal protein CcmA (bactofilin family)
MFNKQTKQPAPAAPAKASLPPLDAAPHSSALGGSAGPGAAAPQVRKSPKASLIADDITIEGNVIGEGELHIDGIVRGDVRVARLSVGETGHIEGSIQAEAVEARGRVVGSIVAKQVRLMGTCYVDGDVTHEQLTMETGAFFQGRSLKFQRQAPAMPVAAATPTPTATPVASAPMTAPAPQPMAAPAAAPAPRPAFGDVVDIG